MIKQLLLALALGAGTVVSIGAANAQAPAKSTQQQDADRHFKNGVARFKEGKFTEALAEFERAYEISPHPLVLYNIAGCYRELSRYGEAVKAYTKFLGDAAGKVPQGRLTDARRELEAIYALVARVTVKVEPAEGATLLLNGEPLGTLPLEMPLILPPGEHKLVARAAGRPDAEKTLRVASGDTLDVELSLAAAPAGGDSPPPPNGGGGTSSGGGGVTVRGPDPAPAARATRRFAVNAGFGTNMLRVTETGVPSVGLGVALGSRLELGVDATLVAYAVVPSLRLRIIGDEISLHAIAAAPIAFTDDDAMDTFVAGAAGLGLRVRLGALALRLESYASFAGETHGTTIPTFLGGELWF